jgi:pyruvate/2-oxoacid:ferredoxin oxidoreductase alpha subunit
MLKEQKNDYFCVSVIENTMKKILLLGDEAIAQGAIDAGLSGVYAYPGTPSTEITEYIQDYCCKNPEE